MDFSKQSRKPLHCQGSWRVGGRQWIVAMKSISRSRQVQGWKPAYYLQEACPWHLGRCLPYQQRQVCMQVPMGSRPTWSPGLQSKFQGSKDYIEKPGLKKYKKVTVWEMMSLFRVLLMLPNVRASGASKSVWGRVTGMVLERRAMVSSEVLIGIWQGKRQYSIQNYNIYLTRSSGLWGLLTNSPPGHVPMCVEHKSGCWRI